ncbi:hypothetical protein DE146DRAFT_676456 [Phaeosphaeria sp. MPI-PUGE-AT-0046c]|nr:hypothetical protein DE146DRAFT_676456 [Phaeosphaeria sp. MPI-PUGE-AT-0046c]
MHLPQELVDHICSYLSPEDLKNAYYVSRIFRKAAEDHAGKYRTLEIEIALENKVHFVRNYSGFRLRYIKHIQFRPYFPDLLVDEESPCRESAEEIYEKDAIFTKQIKGLFAILKKTENIAGIRNRGKYELGIYHPKQAVVGDVCFHREHDLWRVHLLEHETLPDLISVSSFRLRVDKWEKTRAKLDYRIVIDCITHFPNIEEVFWNTGYDEWNPNHDESPADKVLWEYDGPRRDTRHGLSKAITSAQIPESLHTLQFDLFYDDLDSGTHRAAEEIDQTKPMPNLVLPASKDPFSNSIRILTCHLRTLTLRVQADEMTPSGAWYFEGPRGEGRFSIGYELGDEAYPPLEVTGEDEEQHWEFEEECTRAFETCYHFQFRVSPNDNVLEPFLEGFAKAAANMPKLMHAVLWSPLRWNVAGLRSKADRYGYEDFEYFNPRELCAEYGKEEDDLAWGLAYTKPRYHAAFRVNPGEINCEARQMWWAARNWRPNPSLHALIQKIGHREHGKALREYWDDGFGGRTSRWSFEHWSWSY